MKITRKYFFRKKSLLHIIGYFIYDLYKSEKMVEFFSFVIWEGFHRMRLFRKNQYLVFENEKPLVQIDNLLSNGSVRIDDAIEISRSEIEWTLSFVDSSGQTWGCIRTDEMTLYKNSGDEFVKVNQFPQIIKAIYISKQHVIFVCCFGTLFRSDDLGKSFETALHFSYPKSRFLHNNSFTENPDGELFLGEYANAWEKNKWMFVGYIYQSKDNGKSWKKISFLKKANVNKHIHILKYSKLIKGLVLTDGDNKKLLWTNNSGQYDSISRGDKTCGWRKITKFHLQTGGHSTMVELNDRVVFGSDYLGGTNFLITSEDMNLFKKQIVPDPYGASYFTNMVTRQSKLGMQEIWAVLHSSFSSKNKSLLMFSSDSGATWKKVIEYDGTKNNLSIISSSVESPDKLHVLMTPNKAPRISFSVNEYLPSLPALILAFIHTFCLDSFEIFSAVSIG